MPEAFKQSQITITSITTAANAKSAINALSKLTYADYSIKAKAHADIITALSGSLSADEKTSFVEDLKTLYADYGYLGNQVSKNLPPAIRIDIFKTETVPEFKSQLYDELKRSQLSFAPISEVVAAINKQEAQSIVPQVQRTASVAPTSPKELYLNRIATTGMLGYHELQPLANLIGRPIVVVRSEARGDKAANNVEVIAYPSEDSDAQNPPVYVQNSNNYHFRTFIPTRGQEPNPGQSLAGRAVEGDYIGAGANDCLIASLRQSGANFGHLSNQEIRRHCVDYAQCHLRDDVFIPESEVASRTIEFKNFGDVPHGYIGFVLIKQDEDHYFQGRYNNGPVGEWEGIAPNGSFIITYDDDHQITSSKKWGTWGSKGSIVRAMAPSDEIPMSRLVYAH
ncbi:hypothetical protein EBR57_02570 [bacterium]|nr:hypothetical protein [bacterium]